MFYLLFDRFTIRSAEFIERQKILLRSLSRKTLFHDINEFWDREGKLSDVKKLLKQERQQYNNNNGYYLISLSYISSDKRIIISDPEESLTPFFDEKELQVKTFQCQCFHITHI